MRALRSGMETGLTLVELMISITLGMFVVLVATSLLLSTKVGYTAQDEASRIQDAGRFSIESIARSVRQAGLEDWARSQGPVLTTATMEPNVFGLDAMRLKSTTPGIDGAAANKINGSDVLALRFFGTGDGDHGDGAVTNCAGFGVPAATTQQTAEEERGWSIFYVAEDGTGETELYCKFRGSDGWSTQAIARGVESFQVLYGIDSNGDTLPDRFVSAAVIEALDRQLVLDGPNAQARTLDRNRKTYWKKVVVVRVALLIRGSTAVRSDALALEHHLFGEDYSNAYADGDPGTRIRETDIAPGLRNRMRKLFTATIQLRNGARWSST